MSEEIVSEEDDDWITFGGVDEETSRRRALAAGIGLVIVALSYGPSGFGDQDRWWAAGATILVAVALADLLVDLRILLPTPGIAPGTIVVALVAVYLCVPETDQIAIAAFVPIVVVALEVVQRSQVGLEWYAVAAASVGWAGMFGASGRQSALVGALFAWWAVALVPLVHRVRPIPNQPTAVAVAVIGSVAAIVMARTGGIAESGATAAFSALAIGVVSLGFALLVGRLVQLDPDGPADP
jgi:hypothetical protein